MSAYDYDVSLAMSLEDPPFASLLMSMIRKGDTVNRAKIKAAWPNIWKEFWDRYEAAGGLLPSDVERGERHG